MRSLSSLNVLPHDHVMKVCRATVVLKHTATGIPFLESKANFYDKNTCAYSGHVCKGMGLSFVCTKEDPECAQYIEQRIINPKHRGLKGDHCSGPLDFREVAK